MTSYTRLLSDQSTPQSAPLAGREARMTPNNAGGFAFAVDDWTRLERFLILGSDRPTYYVGARDLSRENAGVVRRCLDLDGPRTVQTIVDVSVAGRAPKNDPAIYALALAAKHRTDSDLIPHRATRRAALDALPLVCRIGTHLFQFAEAVDSLGGWGRATRRAVGAWYTDKEPRALAYQLTKYVQRGGWSHRDLVRLSHPRQIGGPTCALRAYAVHGARGDCYLDPETAIYLDVVAQLKDTADVRRAADLIRIHRLVREVVPTELLDSSAVWAALLDEMPLGAMVRNLGKMGSVGLLTPLSDATATVVARLRDPGRLVRARLHPIALLTALKVYASGHGVKGSLSWTPVPAIIDALNDAFYLAFSGVEASGARTLLALDVSGSMGVALACAPHFTAREGATALALVTAATEPAYHIVAFQERLVPLDISPSLRLDEAVHRTSNLPFGRTDCAQPMLYAAQMGLDVDTFIVMTDSETWCGGVHPTVALEQYRQKSGRPAKMIVVGMTAAGFSIADPNDAGSLDIVGFDTSVPAVMSDFGRPAA